MCGAATPAANAEKKLSRKPEEKTQYGLNRHIARAAMPSELALSPLRIKKSPR